jgi:predicted XRE-type DNA-binding protein
MMEMNKPSESNMIKSKCSQFSKKKRAYALKTNIVYNIELHVSSNHLGY